MDLHYVSGFRFLARILGKHQGILPHRQTIATETSSASAGLNRVLLKWRDGCNLPQGRDVAATLFVRELTPHSSPPVDFHGYQVPILSGLTHPAVMNWKEARSR